MIHLRYPLIWTVLSLLFVLAFAAQALASTGYTVQKGDSLFIIGKKFGVSPQAIQQANNLSNTAIYPGQELTIPGSGGNSSVYTVKQGDSLFKIAQKFGTTADAIRSSNRLSGNAIVPGQRLTIPSNTAIANARTHVVKRGESLFTIGRLYRVTAQEIMRTNGLTSATILAGQTLRIPAAAAASASRSSTGAEQRSFQTSQNDINMLARAVYGEARGEPYKGQVAVAAVILNRVKSPDFPSTIAGVIYQPDAFCSVSDGQFYLEPNEVAFSAARAALSGWDPSGNALFFWNAKTATSRWIWSRPIIVQIGNHVFAK
ncbi:MAG: LysM peptidoglycan-binding domain-containing protein [Syntrophomonadaceae bacterium]|nr:LysM peptidoglycan-binding domain-containing protein [Syntrophomonadaceae bacterium]